MAAHESQSLIVEMQACRSDAFLAWLGPELHAAFGGDPAPYRPDNLARLWRRVERGFIRVDADEMTYPAHVILRFRLEQALVAGTLTVADLPGAWNDGFTRAARHRRRRTMRAAACRTSTGTTARSATSPATRWARWRRRN